MKTYKLPKHINGMDGLPIASEDNLINFHHFFSNQLAATDDQKSGIDCVKIMDWARSIYNTGEVTMDASDRSALENWIRTISGFSVLIKTAILDAFKEEK